MRTDPKKGGELRRSPAWQEADRKAAFELGSKAWGKDSLSGNERNRFFLSHRGARFADLSLISGLDHLGDGRSVVLFDYDRDGWQDIAVASTNAPKLTLFHNELPALLGPRATKRRVIALRFVGGNHSPGPSTALSARDGYGARVTVELAGTTVTREHACGEGFSAQNSATLLVGIGSEASAKSIRVRWPSGRIQKTTDIPAGSLLTVYEDPAHSPDGSEFYWESYVRPLRPRAAPLPATAGEERLAIGLERSAERPKLRLYTLTATWCASCKKALPELAHLRSSFAESELGLFGLPGDASEAPEKLAAYAARVRPAYELISELKPAERAAVERILGKSLKELATALPATILTDRDGRVLKSLVGVPTVSEVRRLMAGPTGG